MVRLALFGDELASGLLILGGEPGGSEASWLGPSDIRDELGSTDGCFNGEDDLRGLKPIF